MRALADTALPVPPTVLYHAGDEVIGTPFYLMDRVEGRVFADNALPGMAPAERRAIYLAMAEAMARLHQVDWRAAGLGDFGKPGQFGVQLLTAGVSLAFAFLGTLIILKLVDWTVGLRVAVDEEERGLDISQHEERAYSQM